MMVDNNIVEYVIARPGRPWQSQKGEEHRLLCRFAPRNDKGNDCRETISSIRREEGIRKVVF